MGNMDNRHTFYSQKQNEDFAALEQHIEDLTQEKPLSNLRWRSKEEIKAHLGELEAVKMEYTNVQLECNAADERAKLLASEVIGLEEKALRLRSNELKLEKELEKSQAEMSSFKKKIASLEKDRQDLQSTIDALKEDDFFILEFTRYIFSLILKYAYEKIDVSTSTEDLREDNITSSTINDTNLELNKDLTRKLEVQTQRLELLTAQSMANDNGQARQPDAVSVHDNMPYADEGDEVVERVLGWIMKLFPEAIKATNQQASLISMARVQ
ncbi:hypothetical protein HAX54_008760 [Datura stramonium]|uniref:Uncharacterized protein n=1 Tax=Datura stramonium TaxID=4076 RepID=A0ABS8TEQ8_DATST|nr:hypothetical protein [Datura stramonium]